MSEVNLDELKALLSEFVSAVNQCLKTHQESLSRLAAAVGSLQQNQALEHQNVKEIAEQTNHHFAILTALDAEVKRRFNFSTEEPPSQVH